MNVGYEEKTFETYFNMELSSQGFIFPFGQAQEGVFGTDASVDLNIKSELWKILNTQPLNSKLSLADIEQYLNNQVNNTLKTIKANILVQYKKPEWVSSAKARQRKEWGEPYFRYALRYKLTQNQILKNKREQLDILLDLEKQFGNQALVLYASPAHKDLNELLTAVKNQNLVKSTNFVRLSLLTKAHKHITYTKSGTMFKAHSEVETAERKTLQEHIEQIETHSLTNSDQINFLAKKISSVIDELPSENSLKQAFNLRMEMFDPKIKDFPLISSFTTLKAFTEITAMDWVIAFE